MKFLERMRENKYKFDADWKANLIFIVVFAGFAYFIITPEESLKISPMGIAVLVAVTTSGWVFFLSYGTKWYYQLHPDELQKFIQRDKAQNDKVLRFLHLRK